MTERHLKVQRTARYHQLGDPATARAIWIVVHGYGQLARFFLNSFNELANDRLIVAPEGLSRFYTDAAHQRVGATWMTREDREEEIADHVAYLDALHGLLMLEVGNKPLHVLGFSQGVATVSRWIAMGKARPARIVLWGGSLPPELTAAQLQLAFSKCAVDLVHGKQDELVPEAAFRNNEERLRLAGITSRSLVFPGGHTLDPVILGRCFNSAGA